MSEEERGFHEADDRSGRHSTQKFLDELAKLRAENEELTKDHLELYKAFVELRAENDKLRAFIQHEGYRRCDIRACNCGSWHRWKEVEDDPIDGDHVIDLLESEETP